MRLSTVEDSIKKIIAFNRDYHKGIQCELIESKYLLFKFLLSTQNGEKIGIQNVDDNANVINTLEEDWSKIDFVKLRQKIQMKNCSDKSLFETVNLYSGYRCLKSELEQIKVKERYLFIGLIDAIFSLENAAFSSI